MTILTDDEVAKLFFKTDWKKSSHKTIQKMARDGKIRGKKVYRQWLFDEQAIKDFLMKPAR